MKFYKNPDRASWKSITERPQLDLDFLDGAVRNILNRVKKSGDPALLDLTLQFDKVQLQSLQVNDREIDLAVKSLSNPLKESIEVAASNIRTFHQAQRQDQLSVETMPGVLCWRKPVPITSVGIYIPGGSAPLFSTVLMLGIPASLAGCKEIILCTPPDKDGSVNPAILFAARLTGVTHVFRVGGAQAIAAMAYGTATIPKVFKVFGPGNQYVTRAKQMITEEGIAIDLPAGPSEVLVAADESAIPAFVAADLLSQAEHGEDSQVMLVLRNESQLSAIEMEIARQIDTLPRKEIASRALQNSRAVSFDSTDDLLDFVNAYAPEHLILNLRDTDTVLDRITNAGSVFIGNYAPEAAGDYASGTNHTLPTNGYARAFAGVSLDSFVKYITYQKITEAGLARLGPHVERLAEAEGLIGHKQAIRVRLEKISTK